MKKVVVNVMVVYLVAILGACSKPNVDENGVPKITSAEHPVVNGKAMTPEEFWGTYCKDKPQTTFDPICTSIKTIVNRNSFNNPGPPVKW